MGSRRNLDSRSIIGTWTRVLSNTKVQEIRVGFDQFMLLQRLAFPAINDTPTYSFPGFSIGGDGRYPPSTRRSRPSVRATT